jgi:hypothetical protein
MTKQTEALRLADALCEPIEKCPLPTRLEKEAAAELRRLEAVNKQLLEALKDIAYQLEKARIWGGMDWHYNPLHPMHYLPARDKARAAIAAAKGEA